MWCDLQGHDNELVQVYYHVRIENSRKVLCIKSIGICEADVSKYQIHFKFILNSIDRRVQCHREKLLKKSKTKK